MVVKTWQEILINGLPAICTGIVAILTVILSMMKLSRGQDKALTTAKATHTLVNSDRGVILRLNARQARRIAVITKDKEDINLAMDAEKTANDHDKLQQIVNDREATT